MPLDPRNLLDPRPTQRLRDRLHSGGRCPRCDYNLQKHTGVQCPECGYVLAAELIAGDPPRTLNLTLWLHRAVAVAATVALMVLLGRWGWDWLKGYPRPDLKALAPIAVCTAVWALFEWSNAWLPAQQRKGVARVLLTIFSVVALLTAWRWL